MKIIRRLLLLSPLVFTGCAASKPPVQQAFDIDALVGKNGNELDAVLGTPTNFEGPGPIEAAQGFNDGKKFWNKPEASLVVQYDLNYGRVKYFYLAPGSKTDESVFANEEDMLKLGNLKRDAPNYRLKFVVNKSEAGRYYAVKAIPTS